MPFFHIFQSFYLLFQQVSRVNITLQSSLISLLAEPLLSLFLDNQTRSVTFAWKWEQRSTITGTTPIPPSNNKFRRGNNRK